MTLIYRKLKTKSFVIEVDSKLHILNYLQLIIKFASGLGLQAQ